MKKLAHALLAAFGLPILLFAVLALPLAFQPTLVLPLSQSAHAQSTSYFYTVQPTCTYIPGNVHGRVPAWDCEPADCGSGIVCDEVPICSAVGQVLARGNCGPALCGVGYSSAEECINARDNPPPNPPPNPPARPNPTPERPSQPNPSQSASPSGGGGGSDAGGAVAAGGAVLLGFYFVNHLTDNWTTGPAEFFPEGFELDTTANVVYRDGWSGAFAGVTARYGDWTVAASSAHKGVGWSSPSARVDWRALDYAGWVVNASGSYSGGGWKPYAKVEWSWRF